MADYYTDEDNLYPESLGGEFEFLVGRRSSYYMDEECRYLPADYAVQLPHQCDAWEIAVDPDKGNAIARMELFIKEAHEALMVLRAWP